MFGHYAIHPAGLMSALVTDVSLHRNWRPTGALPRCKNARQEKRFRILKMPDFILLGAVKAGTTSLFHYLGQHRQITMSRMNWPRYFHIESGEPDFQSRQRKYGNALLEQSVRRYRMMCNRRIPRTWEAYRAQWPKPETDVIFGEVSPTYLHDPAVAPAILRRLPKVKLLMVLRNPVERAYSHYLMDFREGWEREPDFGKVLREEPFGIDDFWWGARHNLRHGLYSQRVEEYLQLFPRDQIKILMHDDYRASAQNFLHDIFAFLGVDTGAEIDVAARHNVGVLRLHTKDPASGQTKRVEATPPSLPSKLKRELQDFFRPDVLRLQQLIGKDLTPWLQ
jgi:hypothetical protein